jgi:hypothetical protein
MIGHDTYPPTRIEGDEDSSNDNYKCSAWTVVSA